MKKLISLSNIKSLHDKGQTEIYIDEQTIITPALTVWFLWRKKGIVE